MQINFLVDCLYFVAKTGGEISKISLFSSSAFFFTLKHGYSPVAQFETFEWFMDVMKEILTNYRYNRMGSPVVIDNFFDVKEENSNDFVNEEAYNAILDRMIVLLDLMDEHNQLYNDMDWKEADKKKEDAKNEFFKLFSEQFYGLWD